jgi:hypothetical protein
VLLKKLLANIAEVAKKRPKSKWQHYSLTELKLSFTMG